MKDDEDDDFLHPHVTRVTESQDVETFTQVRVGLAHTEETETCESVDVVLVTPPKLYSKYNRVMEDDDGCVHPPVTDVTEVQSGDTSSKGSEFISTPRTVSCGYNKETDNGESVDDVFVTPPKHNRVIEDKDDFVDPPVTQAI
ncbi:hypothetical protein F2Q69_00035677 [Brassica cretica]|uniref:Uncharacterized protein n=1 Tax=Brassica cretica TaxID=69181 RepID=A0A8S9SHE0_BRACR|nr:hypothetical protein F2Q69_00035677 [Brassica cretica]